MIEVEFDGRNTDHDRLREWLETHVGKMNPLDWDRLRGIKPQRTVLADGQGWRIVNRWNSEVNDGYATFWVEFDRPLEKHRVLEFALRFK